MGKLRALILVSLVCSPLFITANAQQNTLQIGTPIERELGPGHNHDFTVKLEENNLIQLVVEQRGIDVIVKVSTPSGKNLGEYDTPNGREGPEHVSFIAAAAGVYHINITPLDPKDVTVGRYQIKIVELRPATNEELKTTKNLAVGKERGLALLNEIEGTIPEIKSPYTRIKAQLQAAQLLWETDEKRASKYLADAMAGLNEFLTPLNPEDRYVHQHTQMGQLRYEIVQALAARDPDAALNFLHSTGQLLDPTGSQRERLTQDNAIELSIADRIIRNDPKRSLQIARRNLKKGYSANIINTVSQLRQQNPEMAAELANEIATKLVNEKLLKDAAATSLAMSLIRSAQQPMYRVQRGKSVPPAPDAPLLLEDRYRDLLQKVLNEALSYSQAGQVYSPERDMASIMLSTLQEMGPSLDTVAPGAAAAVEKKIAELKSSGNPNYNVSQYSNLVGKNSVEAALESIGKIPAELRDQYYLELANREFNSDDPTRAKQIINDHISNPYQRRQSLISIEQQAIYQAMNKGKVDEALRILSGFRDPRERAQQLANIANQIGPGQKRSAALNLLEQARSMLSSSAQAQDFDQMNALFEIARAFSRYDSKRAFEIIDPLIDQFNELCAAAHTVDGFGGDYYDNDELDLQNGNAFSTIAAQMSTVLGGLALTNFDRAKLASDKIRLPEVRLKVYLDMAQQTIQAAK